MIQGYFLLWVLICAVQYLWKICILMGMGEWITRGRCYVHLLRPKELFWMLWKIKGWVQLGNVFIDLFREKLVRLRLVKPWVKFYGRGNSKLCGKVWVWLEFVFDEGAVAGGFFKRLIGLVKLQLKIQPGKARLTIDELLTIWVETERVLK